ncbi:MAG TPA: hypothetical protein VJ962_12670 [Clostridia bacterium]|nr:hypothetical protein [Clostridia bacterium]
MNIDIKQKLVFITNNKMIYMKYELRQVNELKIIKEPSGIFINSMQITNPGDVHDYAKDNLYKGDIDIYKRRRLWKP